MFCAKLRAWPHNSLWPRLFLIDGLDIKKYERKETDRKREGERRRKSKRLGREKGQMERQTGEQFGKQRDRTAYCATYR